MKAAVLLAPEKMELQDIPVPQLKSSEVLIKVKRCGICGTDPHIYMGRFPAPQPLVLGHEFSGEIVEIGPDVQAVAVGDRVTADINSSCGSCFYCRNGQKLFCENISQIGVHVDGAFAEFVKVPAVNVYKIPDSMSWTDGAYVEPLACAVNGQQRANISLGSTVFIIGAGPMGLSHAVLSKINGAAKVIVSELNPVRIQKAKELGADHVIDVSKQDPLEELLSLTNGRGADFIIEAVGSVRTYEQAFKAVRKGGAIVAYGAAPADAELTIKPFEVYSKELTIVGSYAGTYDTWGKAIELIQSGRFKSKDLVTNTVVLDDLLSGLQSAEKNKDIIKTMVHIS